MIYLSPLRVRLASFEHAYAIATHRRRASGRHQFVVRTGNPLQPVRVMDEPPTADMTLMAIVF